MLLLSEQSKASHDFIFFFALFLGLSHVFSFPPFLIHAYSPRFNVFFLL